MTEEFGRIQPIAPGGADDRDINEILESTRTGWWGDPRMFGVIAQVPEALRGWMHLILGTATVVDPATWELMALRGAFQTGCHY